MAQCYAVLLVKVDINSGASYIKTVVCIPVSFTWPCLNPTSKSEFLAMPMTSKNSVKA